MIELAGRTVAVVGLAQTGVALARFCASRGARVVVTDGKPADKLAAPIAQLEGVAVRYELGGIDEATLTAADLIVMSPGVPLLPPIRAARDAGVEVIAEIELAYRFLDPGATLLAITGTNGKSTTTALTGALCAASGRPTFCGGNLGNMPLIDAIDHPANVPGGLIVAEVAAFMLEHCTTFRGRTGVLTNITPDHLDRFGTLEDYAAIKGRIWDFQRPGDLAIGNAADPLVVRELEGIPSRPATFDSRPGAVLPARGAVIEPGAIALRLDDGAVERYPVDDLVIVGNHNLENAMGAYLAAREVGVPIEAVRAGARGYRPLPHRMELVGERDGVLFYDDSKGTNVASVAASVRGFPRPLVLIAGGVDKGGSYAPLLDALDGGAGGGPAGGVCKGLVLIGEAARLIREAATSHGVTYPIVDAADMHEAVRAAVSLCARGDAVVLSPACASYDMFQNFGHRGRVFRDAVTAVGATRLD